MSDRGFTVWLTGLSGAGKSTLADLLAKHLSARGLRVQRLDGDVVRQDLTADLGFTREDRDKNIARVAFVASLLTRNGVICISSFISPYREAREKARQKIGAFVEVYTECSLDECIRRDVKGLYRKALAGEISSFTGISDPYEPPEQPEITVRTDRTTPEECVTHIVMRLEELGYLAPIGLIPPHGGRLVERVASPRERSRLEGNVARDIQVDYETAKEVENIATGVYSPLTGFLGLADYRSVLATGRLAAGTPWTLPILLHVPEDAASTLAPGCWAGLLHGGCRVGVIQVKECYRLDRADYAQAVYGTTSESHPGVARLAELSDRVVAGPVTLLAPLQTPFPNLKFTPRETRRAFAQRGWKTVVAFQTRNAPHLGHEYLQKTALSVADGLFVNPVIGRKKQGDFTDEAIIAACQALMKHYFSPERAMLGILEYEMRYAGPREAIHHAIMRKNLGCTHLIIGRDHAGVGGFYGPYEAQEIFERYPDLGIEPVRFGAFYFCRKCRTITNDRVCPHGPQDRVNFSGTAIRAALSAKELDLSSETAITVDHPARQDATAALPPIRPQVLDALRRQPRVFVGEQDRR